MSIRSLALLFTPRMMMAAAAVLVVGLAASFLAHTLAERLIAADMQRRFTFDAAETSGTISESLRAHAEVLVGMQALYASVDHIDRAQFRRYVDVLDLSQRYPGFQALQVVRYVRPDELDSFVAEIRSDKSYDPSGQPDFAVHPGESVRAIT
jgi:CHASE1-domain containing sensor protein